MNNDSELVAATLRGDMAAFEELIKNYQPRIFATARRYARLENEVEDIVQEVFIKAYQKLASFRGEAPFEHWLMRLAVRTCYDFLRRHQRNREIPQCDLSQEEQDWLDRFASNPDNEEQNNLAARELVQKALANLCPQSRMIINLLEIEDRSVKEVAQLMGWSCSLVKVRAFRARREMKKYLEKLLHRTTL